MMPLARRSFPRLVIGSFSFTFATFAMLAGVAHAQPYPAKPIRIIVPFPPGGSTDLMARRIGEKLQAAWGQPVVVDNRPGAGGTTGAEALARSAPDGYTIGFGVTGTHSISPLVTKLAYDPQRDFTPISLVVSAPLVLVVGPSVPARTIAEVTALAKAKPGVLTHGTPGNATSMHLTGELYDLQAGVKTTHVPYKGSANAMNDLLGGQISMMWADVLVALPHIKSGKIQPIATTGPARHYTLPDVPTVTESGLAGVETASWQGLFGPAGMPRDVVGKLNAEIVASLKLADIQEFLRGLGFVPIGSSPEAFAAHLQAEITKWSRVVRAANVTQ